MNKNKTKLVKASIISTIVILSGVGATALMSKPEPAVKEVKQSAEVKSTPVATPEAVTPVEQSTPATEVVEPVEVQPVAEPPKVLSIQEYGEMYLDLTSTKYQQMCFDLIVNHFPDRFTEDVRERNIKMLQIFAAPCSTRIMDTDDSNGVRYELNRGNFFDAAGPNGVWFDMPH